MPASRLLYRPRGEHSLSHLGSAILGCSTHPEGPGQPQLLPPLPVAPRVAGGFREDHVSPREASLIPAGAAPDPPVRDPSISHGTKQLYSHNRLCKSWRPYLPPGTRPSPSPKGPSSRTGPSHTPSGPQEATQGAAPCQWPGKRGNVIESCVALEGKREVKGAPPPRPSPSPRQALPLLLGQAFHPLQQPLIGLCSSTSCCYMHLHACTTNADTGTLTLTRTYIQAQTYTSTHAYKWRHKHVHIHLCYMPRNTYRHMQTCVDTIITQPGPAVSRKHSPASFQSPYSEHPLSSV